MKTDGFLLKKKGKQRETKRKYKKNMNDESRIRRIPTDERMKSYEFKGTKNNAQTKKKGKNEINIKEGNNNERKKNAKKKNSRIIKISHV